MLDNICDEIFQDSYNWYAEDEYQDSQLVYCPLPLHGVWIKGPEYCDRRDNLIHHRQTTEQRQRSKYDRIPKTIPLDRNNNQPPEGVEILDYESDSDDYLTEPVAE